MSQNQLSQPQLQYLKCITRTTISNQEQYLAELKAEAKYWYSLADPDNKQDGQFFFDKLNEARSEIAYVRKHLQNLRALQKQFKKMLNASW